MPQKNKAAAKTAAAKAATARHVAKPATQSVKVVAKSAKTSEKNGAKNLSTSKPVASKPVASKVTAKSSAHKPVHKSAAKRLPVASAAPIIAKVADKKVVDKKSAAMPAAKKPVAAVAKAAVVEKPQTSKPDAAKFMTQMRAPAAAPAAVAKSVPAAIAKQAAQRISSPPITPQQQAAKALEAQRQQQAVAAAAAASKKPVSARHGFKTNEFIVYPAHGVGRIVGIEEQEIAGMALELFVITFEKDKMTLRVPTGKLQSVGMRKLADEAIVKRAMETLKGRARIKRTMWSRRAQEYEAKINSGDLISIAEVVRDLYRSETQPEQSYSERQLYEAALDRMAREIAAVDKLDERGAVQKITEVLSKSAKGRRAAEEEAEAEASDEGDEEVQAA
ncbi:MAG: CarD family transcriptional regulator [Hyphomicrobiaceae bacterium]